MNDSYPAKYRDRHGEEMTVIRNDGKTLSMVVRGVEFRGSDFDMLEPAAGAHPAAMETFTVYEGDLCCCTIDFEMPVPVAVGESCRPGTLLVRLELGNPRPKPRGGIDREDLSLVLCVGGERIRSRGDSGGWFEDELGDIQRQLPADSYLKACINCAFSDYYPAGHGLFGGLACFRDKKEAYLSVKSKHDLFRIWNSMTEFVQETYLCPEFCRRHPGTGYRG